MSRTYKTMPESVLADRGLLGFYWCESCRSFGRGYDLHWHSRPARDKGTWMRPDSLAADKRLYWKAERRRVRDAISRGEEVCQSKPRNNILYHLL